MQVAYFGHHKRLFRVLLSFSNKCSAYRTSNTQLSQCLITTAGVFAMKKKLAQNQTNLLFKQVWEAQKNQSTPECGYNRTIPFIF